MPSLKPIIKTTCLSVVALSMSVLAPFSGITFAAECVAPSATEPGVHAPTGSDAATFIYQCEGAHAGKYINDYYIYDPAANERTPRFNLDYDYNCTTAKWTMTQYNYYPADGQYHAVRVDAGSRPGVPTGCVVPAAPTTPTGSNTSSTTSGGINNTGQGSDNTINSTGTSNQNLTNNTNVGMNNVLTGVATSGSAAVMNNTVAGSATTGSAQDIANIVNMLQSTSNALGAESNVVVFTKDIDGDVYGDLILDPAQLGATQNAIGNTGEGSNNSINNNGADNLTVNNSLDANIDNDVNLIARSGDATVANNTRAGDATTGNAKAVANIVNVINSALTAGKSFIGVININGNLNGDILLPENFVDQLIAANVPTIKITTTGAGSNNTVNNASNQNTTVNNTNDLGITNNVNTTATSGNANVTRNTNAGNATTGNATTSITAFNLTGSHVIGSNALLVFVNSHGNWVGLIVNAPKGASAAALGGNISTTGSGSNNTVNNNSNGNTEINNDVRARINNDVTVTAVSGDANVDANTNAGNARTGNADARVNLMNMENSNFTLTGWLGILFINVFGSWNGSFGVDTAAGDPLTGKVFNSGAGSVKNAPAAMQVFRFVPNNGSSNTGSAATVTSSEKSTPSGTVLAAYNAQRAQATGADTAATSSRNLLLPILATLLFAAFIVLDRLSARASSNKA